MEDLDFLKQHWKKDDDFPKVDREEIRRMLHRSSSSIVKWIFFISVLELLAGLALNFFLPGSGHEPGDPAIMIVLEDIFSVVFYVVVIYFIYMFFTSYTRIKNTNSTRELLGDILKTRKYVDQYIKFNVLYILGTGVVVTSFILYQESIERSKSGDVVFFLIAMIIFMALFMWLLIFVVRMYYKVLYRRLVKKLNKNYDELVKLEEEQEINS